MRRSKAGPKASKVKLYNRRAYNKDGVDLSHIRGFLEKTPAERLRDATSAARFILQVRELNRNA
jgi:hypothetical protein